VVVLSRLKAPELGVVLSMSSSHTEALGDVLNPATFGPRPRLFPGWRLLTRLQPDQTRDDESSMLLLWLMPSGPESPDMLARDARDDPGQLVERSAPQAIREPSNFAGFACDCNGSMFTSLLGKQPAALFQNVGRSVDPKAPG
jgi:hypothetical protein